MTGRQLRTRFQREDGKIYQVKQQDVSRELKIARAIRREARENTQKGDIRFEGMLPTICLLDQAKEMGLSYGNFLREEVVLAARKNPKFREFFADKTTRYFHGV